VDIDCVRLEEIVPIDAGPVSDNVEGAFCASERQPDVHPKKMSMLTSVLGALREFRYL